MALKYNRTADDLIELEVEDISSWEGFENIVRFLEKDFNAIVIKKFDGPDARTWKLQIAGHIITVQHLDTRGNWLSMPAKEGEKIITSIGERLKERLDKYN